MNNFIVKIGFDDKEFNCPIYCDGSETNLEDFIFKLVKEKDIYRLSVRTQRTENIKWIALTVPFSKRLFGKNTYFYDDSFGTNAQTRILKQIDNIGYSSAQVIAYKNLDNGVTFGVGYVEANRFYQTFMQKEKSFDLCIDMENKSLNPGEAYEFERFIISKRSESTNDFLDRYGKTINKINNINIPKEIPSGFCSWSRYYGNINEKKINGQIRNTYKYLKDRKPNTIQLDDGWQIDGTFAGKFVVDKSKFPSGLEELIRKIEANKMKFGLWFCPYLARTSSSSYEDIKDLIAYDNKIDCLGEDVYAFDFDNPKYYDYLREQFGYYRHSLGVKYFKVDFLEHPFTHGHNYKSDYRIALFRKGIKAIREAVGDDTILVGCTGFVLPFAGIFNINRITCDIIWGKSTNPTYYELIQAVSKTIFYRYFYNNNLQINDPDGIVVRNYDVGDYFNVSHDEAKIVASMIMCSGGSVLHNEELNHLEADRLKLIQRLSPAIGISARPLDYFENNSPTTVYIDRLKAKNPYVLVSVFNYGENEVEKEFKTSTFGIEKGIVISAFDNRVIGICDSVKENLKPHSSEIYVIIPVPSKPEFLFSDINFTLGRELFSLKCVDGCYFLTAKYKSYMKYEKFIFVPNGFEVSGQAVKDLGIGKVVKFN